MSNLIAVKPDSYYTVFGKFELGVFFEDVDDRASAIRTKIEYLDAGAKEVSYKKRSSSPMFDTVGEGVFYNGEELPLERAY